MGRENDLKTLHEQLQQQQTVAISAIAGMGGVGKTELAWQYAYEQGKAGTYPGGICWLRAREGLGTQIVLFARSQLGLKIPDDEELAAQVARCWGQWPEQETLLVFDDVQQYHDVESVLPPARSRFKVLLTTRSRFGHPVQNFEIKVLSEAASLELLRELVQDGRIDRELETAKQVCEWLGWLPLGLELVGRYLARKKDVSVVKLWQRLQEKRLAAKALLEAEPGMTASLGITAAFELSWQELDPAAQQLAALLSLFALAEIPWRLVEACLPEADAEELEDLRDARLLDVNLLQRVDEERYVLHQLLREFFAVKREQRSDVAKLKQKLYEVVIAEAEKVRDKPERSIMKESTLIIAHLEEAIKFLKNQKKEMDIANCLFWIAELHTVQGSYCEAELLYQEALRLRQRQLGDEHLDIANCLDSLAALYRWQGRYCESESLYEKALALKLNLLGNEHPAVAVSLNNLAALYYWQERYGEAEPLYKQALSLRRQLLGPEHPSLAISLNNLGVLYRVQKRYIEAESLLQEALALRRRLLGSMNPTVATSLNNLGTLYREQGCYNEAELFYQQALKIDHHNYGANHPSTAVTLNGLASVYRLQGLLNQAESLILQSLPIFLEKFGDSHPWTQRGLENFRLLLQKAIQENRTDELSDDPMTQSILQELQAHALSLENDQE